MENSEKPEINEENPVCDENEQVILEGIPELQENLQYLKSNKSWEDLKIPEDLSSKLYLQNYKTPSKIQNNIISIVQSNLKKDIVAQSQNGSGKTLAFLIPSILLVKKNKVSEKKNQDDVFRPIVLILADTKELCFQTEKILNLIKTDEVIVQVLLKEVENMDYNANIIISTIGSFLSFLNKKKLLVDNMKFFVLDETDKLFSQDFGKNKLASVFKLLSKVNNDCQIGMFSATFPESCLEIINSLGRQVAKVIIQKQDINLNTLTHYFIKCSRDNKLTFMNEFLRKYSIKFFQGSVIIFVNSKNFAEQFANKLLQEGHKCEILTSDMSHDDRISIMNEFKAGKIRVLVSTNLIARGIDNRKVNLVINLDLPYHFEEKRKKEIDLETYLHRVGRTGRFGDKGIALNIVENERDFTEIQKINSTYGINLIEVTFDNFGHVLEQTEENLDYNLKKRQFLEENI
jgi:ATP-dependent RNA helicase DDX19/DBP5